MRQRTRLSRVTNVEIWDRRLGKRLRDARCHRDQTVPEPTQESVHHASDATRAAEIIVERFLSGVSEPVRLAYVEDIVEIISKVGKG